jgi:hypothetical protein
MGRGLFLVWRIHSCPINSPVTFIDNIYTLWTKYKNK